MINFRRQLFWVFTAAYLVLCPAVVLYALGYFKTGMLILDVMPAEARIWMGRRLVKGPWPVRVSRVPPGEYVLNLRADGYQALDRTVTVARGKATVLDHLLLIPSEPGLDYLSVGPFVDLVPVEHTPYILLQRNDRADGLHVFDSRELQLRKIFERTPYAPGLIRRIHTVRGSSCILAETGFGTASAFLWTDLSAAKPAIRNVSEGLGAAPSRILWDATSPAFLFSYQEGTVRRAQLSGKGQHEIFEVGWRGIGAHGGSVLGLDRDYRIVRTAFAGKAATKKIDDDTGKGRRVFRGEGRFLIEPVGNDCLVFLGERGQLLQSDQPHLLVENGVRGVRIAADRDRVLVWTSTAIGIIEPPPEDRTPGLLEQGREVAWIHEDGTDIRAACFAHEDSHALALDGDAVFLVDLASGASPRARKIIDVKPGTSFAYHENEGMLYALVSEKGHLVAVRVIPAPAFEGEFAERGKAGQ